MNWERWARAAGIGFFLFTVAAFIVGGEPPKVSDSPEDVVAYFTDNRSQVLLSSFLFAVGLVLFLWFAGAVANTLREHGEGRVAATALAAGTAWVVIQLVLTAITAALAHSIATDGDATGVRALFNLSWVLDMLGALPIAATVLAVSVGLRPNTDDSAVAQLGRCRCLGAPGSTQHHLGARRILVTDRRVPVHHHSSGAALDPDHKHRVGSQRACTHDDAGSTQRRCRSRCASFSEPVSRPTLKSAPGSCSALADPLPQSKLSPHGLHVLLDDLHRVRQFLCRRELDHLSAVVDVGSVSRRDVIGITVAKVSSLPSADVNFTLPLTT